MIKKTNYYYTNSLVKSFKCLNYYNNKRIVHKNPPYLLICSNYDPATYVLVPGINPPVCYKLCIYAGATYVLVSGIKPPTVDKFCIYNPV